LRQALVVVIAMAILGTAKQAAAAPRPYCLDADRTHFQDCTYYTFEQCLATAYGLNGICYQNPAILWQQREGRPHPTVKRNSPRRQ
jgi:Protein of unknown function (DUF3551)